MFVPNLCVIPRLRFDNAERSLLPTLPHLLTSSEENFAMPKLMQFIITSVEDYEKE